nr:MAG TPA: hypothetical protein [Caudoviricetes sp.]
MTSKKTSKTAEHAREIGAATPKDFQEAEANGGGVVEVTVDGLTVAVDPTVFQSDWEVIEALAAMEDGSASPAAMMRVTRAVLGDAYDDVKAHVRKDGKVNADAMGEFLQQVFEALNAGN